MINFSERNEEIFHLRYNEGISPKELSLQYGIHVSTIYNICKKIKLMKNSRKNDLFALCEKYCKYSMLSNLTDIPQLKNSNYVILVN